MTTSTATSTATSTTETTAAATTIEGGTSGTMFADAAALAHAPTIALPDGGVAIHIPPTSPQRGTVLLLHGWVMNRAAWAEAAHPLLAHGFGLLMPDLPGHGGSAPLPVDVASHEHFDAIAARVLTWLDALQLSRVHVGGFSMGSTTTLSLLKLAPHRLERAMLLDPMFRFPLLQCAYNPPRGHARLLWNFARGLVGPRGGAFVRAILGLALHGLPFPTSLRRAAADALADDRALPRASSFGPYDGLHDKSDVEVFLAGLARTDFRATSSYFAASYTNAYDGVLEGFDRPMLIGTGALDTFSPPAFVQSVARRRTRAGERMRLIPDADHCVLSANPRAVSALLHEWLDLPPPVGA